MTPLKNIAKVANLSQYFNELYFLSPNSSKSNKVKIKYIRKCTSLSASSTLIDIFDSNDLKLIKLKHKTTINQAILKNGIFILGTN